MRIVDGRSNVPSVGRVRAAAAGSTALRPVARPRGMPMPGARAFDAAKTDRLTGAWGTEPMPADQIIIRHQRVLVARSREQSTNNDHLKGYIASVARNVVGSSGVILQAQCVNSQGKPDLPARAAVEAAWREWGRPANCCVKGQRSFRLQQKLAIRSAAINGEFMVRKIYGPDAGPWGFALQFIDPQRCPPMLCEDRLPGGGFIRCGIEFNKYGRPLAYLLQTANEHEADRTYGGRSYVRVPAGEIIHAFLEDIEGQRRGLPWGATALWRLQMLSQFEKAALVNARVGASKGGFFEWRDGFTPSFEGEEDDGEEREPLQMSAEPGEFEELPVGLTFKEWNPQYPTGDLAPFLKAMLRGAASGLGVAYNSFANDLEGVNFSSIRQGVLDEREAWMELQEWFIEAFHERVFEAWLDVALLAGRITVGGTPVPAARREKHRAVRWQGRRWSWVDPVKDIQSRRESQKGLLSSPGEAIRETGRDPIEVYTEFAGDLEAMKAAGIPDKFIEAAFAGAVAGGAPGKPGAPGAPSKADPPADDEDDEGTDDGEGEV